MSVTPAGAFDADAAILAVLRTERDSSFPESLTPETIATLVGVPVADLQPYSRLLQLQRRGLVWFDRVDSGSSFGGRTRWRAT